MINKTNPVIEIKLLNTMAKLPKYATPGSAGLDLSAAMPLPMWINPGDNALIPTGISININDPSIVAVLVGRSGMALNNRIRLANSVGICDADYLKEIGAILYNDGSEPYCVMPGDRVAQMLIMPVLTANMVVVDEFCVSNDRGGYGSTGVN